MKNKKLMGFLIALVCMLLCSALVLTGCREDVDDPTETVGSQTQAPTVGENTEPEETQPEPTQPEETEPTEPEETENEETEPEETEGTGSSTGSNTNTGTGGGYDPGTSDPTEPEDATEPEIVVPTAGSENNAYAEYVPEGTGTFTTVTIPAGQTMYYRLKTPGSFLRVEDEDAKILTNDGEYVAENGVLEMALPADGSQTIAFAIVNQNAEDKAFAVEVRDVVGSKSNPIVLDSIADVQAALEAGDADGVYYGWIADRSGVLKMTLDRVQCADGTAYAVVTVNNNEVRLSEGDEAAIAVSQGDEVLIQVVAEENADGSYGAAQMQLGGYVAVTVDLEVSEIPFEIESVTVGGNQSVIYRITGNSRKSFKITDGDFVVVYDAVVYSPNEQGVIEFNLPGGKSAAEVELINQTPDAKTTQLYFDYPMGHQQNPHSLTALGSMIVEIPDDLEGYYYSLTAKTAGMVTFQIWTYPEIENVKTDIQITNETSGKTATLWTEDENGEAVENATVSVPVNAGDEVTVFVSVTDIFGYAVYTELEIYGELYGTEELPIIIEYPGFTAYVPAGETLYYEGYNMADLILSMIGTDAQIGHNGNIYTADNGLIRFDVVAQGRNPARFAITNLGSEDAVYEVAFAYPVGHSENPDTLLLGVNTVVCDAGQYDYCYNFKAPRAGTLTLIFDSNAQWVYTVDNLTQGVYGDTQWSDSDPLMSEVTLTVKANDQIQIRVNTYDADNMFESPAGSVVFEAKYITGPTTIRNTDTITYATLIPGEGAAYTGNFYGLMLKVSGAKNAAVEYDGVLYTANATGNITVKFPASGTGNLQYVIYNTGTEQSTMTMQFSSGEVGTTANPETISTGSYSMVQDEVGGAVYYYEIMVETTGTMIFTFETDVDAFYMINNSVLRYTNMGQNTYRMYVRAGQVISLAVNTYDQNNPRVSPEGVVDFTIEMQ